MFIFRPVLLSRKHNRLSGPKCLSSDRIDDLSGQICLSVELDWLLSGRLDWFSVDRDVYFSVSLFICPIALLFWPAGKFILQPVHLAKSIVVLVDRDVNFSANLFTWPTSLLYSPSGMLIPRLVCFLDS